MRRRSSPKERKSWQKRSIPLDIQDSCYSPECGEGKFCELPLYGVLKKFAPALL